MGTLSLRKNVGTLLEAYARLRTTLADAPPLVLAGHRTPASARWEARCEQPPLKGHVTITGYVESGLKNDLYADALMLVLPSYEEGFGLPVLEAMACGVPVIVSSRGSLPEVAGPAAAQIDPDDADGFARAMRALLEGDATAAGERGVAQAAKSSWPACAEAARRAYQSAIEVRLRGSRFGGTGPCASRLTLVSCAAGPPAWAGTSPACSTPGRRARRPASSVDAHRSRAVLEVVAVGRDRRGRHGSGGTMWEQSALPRARSRGAGRRVLCPGIHCAIDRGGSPCPDDSRRVVLRPPGMVFVPRGRRAAVCSRPGRRAGPAAVITDTEFSKV